MNFPHIKGPGQGFKVVLLLRAYDQKLLYSFRWAFVRQFLFKWENSYISYKWKERHTIALNKASLSFHFLSFFYQKWDFWKWLTEEGGLALLAEKTPTSETSSFDKKIFNVLSTRCPQTGVLLKPDQLDKSRHFWSVRRRNLLKKTLGSFAFKTRKGVISVIRSPFVYKSSREQFYLEYNTLGLVFFYTSKISFLQQKKLWWSEVNNLLESLPDGVVARVHIFSPVFVNGGVYPKGNSPVTSFGVKPDSSKFSLLMKNAFSFLSLPKSLFQLAIWKRCQQKVKRLSKQMAKRFLQKVNRWKTQYHSKVEQKAKVLRQKLRRSLKRDLKRYPTGIYLTNKVSVLGRSPWYTRRKQQCFQKLQQWSKDCFKRYSQKEYHLFKQTVYQYRQKVTRLSKQIAKALPKQSLNSATLPKKKSLIILQRLFPFLSRLTESSLRNMAFLTGNTLVRRELFNRWTLLNFTKFPGAPSRWHSASKGSLEERGGKGVGSFHVKNLLVNLGTLETPDFYLLTNFYRLKSFS